MNRFLKNIIILFLLIYVILYGLQYIQEIPKRKKLAQKTEKNYIKWTGFKEENPNTIFLGSSKMYCSINPLIFDSITSLHSYNLATSSQSLIESYYFLDYAISVHPQIKNVVVGLSQSAFNEIDYYHALANAEYLDKKHKWDFIVNGLGLKGICFQLIPFLKYQGYVDLLGKKKNPESGKWEKGYFSDKKIIDSIKYDNDLKKSHIETVFNQENLKYISKIVQLCKEKNIVLVFTRTPLYPKLQESMNFEIEYIDSLSKLNQTPFFHDYQISSYNKSDFSNEVHNNITGGVKSSTFLANWFLKNIIKR